MMVLLIYLLIMFCWLVIFDDIRLRYWFRICMSLDGVNCFEMVVKLVRLEKYVEIIFFFFVVVLDWFEIRFDMIFGLRYWLNVFLIF